MKTQNNRSAAGSYPAGERWPEYLRRIEAGETLVLTKEGKPVALRPYALCAGELIAPDNFDAPLPDDIVTGFEG